MANKCSARLIRLLLQGQSDWIHTVCPDLSVQKLGIITVHYQNILSLFLFSEKSLMESVVDFFSDVVPQVLKNFFI